jgi:hypothetical protein
LPLTPEAEDSLELDEEQVDKRSTRATPPMLSQRCIAEGGGRAATMSSEKGRCLPMTPIELGNTFGLKGEVEEDEEKKYKVDLLKEGVGEGLEG